MNDRDQRRYDRGTRVQTFGNETKADFAAGGLVQALFASVARRIAEADHAKAEQRPARVSKETRRDALHLDPADIARTARAVDLDEPGFAAPYLLPATPAEAALLTHVDAVLAQLEDKPGDAPAELAAKTARRAKFIAYEMPADFVLHLREDVDALRAATAHNQGENQEGVESTAGLSAIFAALAKDIQKLDAAVRNKYARNPAKLAAWHSASRVQRAPRREKKPDAPAQTPPSSGSAGA